MNTIQQLEEHLTEKIKALEEQRRQDLIQFEAEKEAWRRRQADEVKLANAERIRKIEEEEKLRAAQQEEIIAKNREIARREKEIEAANNAAQEAKRQQEEKLEWLRNEISRQEFIEEQHRKALESIKNQVTQEETENKINVEHPVAPDNKGEAVSGTEGETPKTPLMSEHLKQVLRQATRSY